jgi:hypothetical protein
LKTISDFILKHDGQVKIMLQYLDDRLANHHGLRSKISYGIPMYSMHAWICYLNPKKTGGLELCFTRGIDLSNEHGFLDLRGRKMIAGVYFHHIADIPERALDETIQEAILLDEWRAKRKKKWNES